MANINLAVADLVYVAESIEQMTLPAAEDITAGDLVRIDTSSGKFTKANGSSDGEARVYGVATQTRKAGFGLTAIAKGVMSGWVFDALAFDAPLYASDTDGRIADAAGTVSKVIGRVIPVTGTTLGRPYDKVLRIEL